MSENNENMSMGEFMESINTSMKKIHPGDFIDGKIISVNENELLVNIGYISDGIVPREEITEDLDINLKEIFKANEEIKVCVLEINNGEGCVLLSKKRADSIVNANARILEKEDRENRREELLKSITKGEKREGIVTRLAKFGAFVDLGGIDGLIHISELSWSRVNDPADVVKVGDKVTVSVIDADKEKGKISLSLKDIKNDPWNDITSKYEINSIVPGVIKKIIQIGAFVEIAPGIDGLVHISEISEDRVNKIEDKLTIGDTVKVKILDINKKDKRISLSIKDALENHEAEYLEYKDDEDLSQSLGDIFKDKFKDFKF